MKLQIIRQNQEGIQGYETVRIEKPNSLELSHIVDNSCELILASDIMDSFQYNSVPQVCHALLSKLRIRGEVVVGGTDIRFFSKYVSNGVFTPEEACNLVTAIFSMSTSDLVREELEKMGLKIISVHMDGIHYEIKAMRV